MNSQELENFLKTEFTAIKTYPTGLIALNRDNLDYFVESCHESKIREIIPLYHDKVTRLMNTLPGIGTLTQFLLCCHS
ncbi:hypothetical protein LPTSP3_g31850 [Leptospira kobayashii]|uniref:Uncharacterized protein n=1 Tax=Leptospira kobayashii TaxID=1917830 RepID=A0ABM7UMD9_9LEPT|nr:hypothetical protein LPTSP3_g31850 [Leptospira kobayashii]